MTYPLLTLREATRKAYFCIGTLRRWIYEGRLRTTMYRGTGRTNGWRITDGDLTMAVGNHWSDAQREANAVANHLILEFNLKRVHEYGND